MIPLAATKATFNLEDVMLTLIIRIMRIMMRLMIRAMRSDDLDVEFVKSFTPVRFPNLSILPEKSA